MRVLLVLYVVIPIFITWSYHVSTLLEKRMFSCRKNFFSRDGRSLEIIGDQAVVGRSTTCASPDRDLVAQTWPSRAC
jgi:hypothetical protein